MAPAVGGFAQGSVSMHPQAERAIAADAHCIARVLCDEVLFYVFLAEALKKNTVCPVVKKGPVK